MPNTPHLPVLRIDCKAVALEPSRIPENPSHFWRSLFGMQLRRLSEGEIEAPSHVSRFATSELWSYFYKSRPAPGAEKMSAIKEAPHPYVLDAPRRAGGTTLAPLDETRFSITLIGHAAEAAPAVLLALRNAAFESRHCVLELAEADAVWRAERDAIPIMRRGELLQLVPAESPTIPQAPDRAQIRLLSPTILRRNKKTVEPRDFALSDWVGRLIRRISLLQHFYCDDPLDLDFRELKRIASDWAPLEQNLCFTKMARWSAKQKKELDMSGIEGLLTIDLSGKKELWPFLWLGQWVHVGKSASLGHGALRVLPQ